MIQADWKTKLEIVTVVWGRSCIEIFLNYCLPSLGKIADKDDVSLIIYTKAKDKNYLSHLSAEIRLIDGQLFTTKSAIEIQSTVMKGHNKGRGQVNHTLFLAPDTIWSRGALELILFDISNGVDIAYIHYCRVLQDEILELTPLRLLNRSPKELYKLALGYLSPIHNAHNLDSCYSSRWPEYYFTRENEVEVTKLVAKEPLVINWASELNEKNQISNLRRFDFKIYGGTDDVFCLSLTPKAKDQDWYETYSKLTSNKVANWSLRYATDPYNNALEDRTVIWSTESVNIVTLSDRLETFRRAKDVRAFVLSTVDSLTKHGLHAASSHFALWAYSCDEIDKIYNYFLREEGSLVFAIFPSDIKLSFACGNEGSSSLTYGLGSISLKLIPRGSIGDTWLLEDGRVLRMAWLDRNNVLYCDYSSRFIGFIDCVSYRGLKVYSRDGLVLIEEYDVFSLDSEDFAFVCGSYYRVAGDYKERVFTIIDEVLYEVKRPRRRRYIEACEKLASHVLFKIIGLDRIGFLPHFLDDYKFRRRNGNTIPMEKADLCCTLRSGS